MVKNDSLHNRSAEIITKVLQELVLVLTGEIGRVGEQDGPLALLPLVKALNGSVSGVGGKVWDNVSQSHTAVGGRFGVQTHVHFGSRL